LLAISFDFSTDLYQFSCRIVVLLLPMATSRDISLKKRDS